MSVIVHSDNEDVLVSEQIVWLVLNQFEQVKMVDYCDVVVNQETGIMYVVVLGKDFDLVFEEWCDYEVLYRTVKQYKKLGSTTFSSSPVEMFLDVLWKRLNSVDLNDFETVFYPPLGLVEDELDVGGLGVSDLRVLSDVGREVPFIGADSNFVCKPTSLGVDVFVDCTGFFHRVFYDQEQITSTNLDVYVETLEDVKNLNPFSPEGEDEESYWDRVTYVAARIFACKVRGVVPGFWEVFKVTSGVSPLTKDLFPHY